MKIVFASEEVGEPEEQQALTTGYQISVSRVQRRRNWTDFGLWTLRLRTTECIRLAFIAL